MITIIMICLSFIGFVFLISMCSVFHYFCTSAFFNDKKRNRVKTLDEYYFIRGECRVSSTAQLTRISLEDHVKESDQRMSRKIVICLLLCILVQSVLLLGFFVGSMQYSSYPALLYLLFARDTRDKSEEPPSAVDCVTPSSYSEPSQFSSVGMDLSDNITSENTTLIDHLDLSDNITSENTTLIDHSDSTCVVMCSAFLTRSNTLWGSSSRIHALPSNIHFKLRSLASRQLIWDSELFFKKNDWIYTHDVSKIVSDKISGKAGV